MRNRMKHVTAKPLLASGTGLVALALLAGCGGGGGEPAAPPAQEGETPATSPTQDDNADDQGQTGTESDGMAGTESEGMAGTESEGAMSGQDAVFTAIGAVLAEHSGGIITEIDREDDRDEFEVDVVVGDQLIQVDVLEDGTLREDDRDDDEEDIAEAQEAQVTAEAAITTALEGRDGQILDEAQLEEEDGTLYWQIDLDQVEGGDGDELYVDAMTGELVRN